MYFIKKNAHINIIRDITVEQRDIYAIYLVYTFQPTIIQWSLKVAIL